jgi:DNA-binding transcriptional LysR family regulator
MSMDDLATFVRAVDAGSVSGAARALGVPKSTVSRRLQRLEAEVGQPLLHRTPRAFRLTDAGRELYDRVAPACRDLVEATRAMMEGVAAPAGVLRVTAPTDFGTTPTFVQMLCGFRARYPDVHLEVLLTERLVDLVAEGVDFAFRAHAAPLDDRSTLTMRKLVTLRGGLYATPGYLASRGRPLHPRDLEHHEVFAPAMGGPMALRSPDPDGPSFALRSSIRNQSFAFVRAAVECGAGLGVLPTPDGALLSAQGRVERVLDDWVLPSGTLSLLWPSNRQMAPRARAFVDHVVACLPSGCQEGH